SAVWGAVSVAVSIVFALSWPAFIKSVQRRQWVLAPMVLAALILTGAYSVTAALGSASGGRTNAAALETATTDARARAQAAYDGAKAELDGLKPSRPAAELEALLAARTVGGNCHLRATLSSRTMACSPPTTVATELGRAKRRVELEAKMDAARIELERIAAPKQANSDATAKGSAIDALVCVPASGRTDAAQYPSDAFNNILELVEKLIGRFRTQQTTMWRTHRVD